jgi:curved DNA-binding protein CbpA
MKDYYEVLGVSRDASPNDIKRAFRRLVQLYHPDRNPDPSALETIQTINEAYDVLGDEKQRTEYDVSLNNPYATYIPPEPQHRDPAYRRSAYRPPTKPKEDPQRELMEKGLPLAKVSCWVGLLVCLFLLIDLGIARIPHQAWPEPPPRTRRRCPAALRRQVSRYV